RRRRGLPQAARAHAGVSRAAAVHRQLPGEREERSRRVGGPQPVHEDEVHGLRSGSLELLERQPGMVPGRDAVSAKPKFLLLDRRGLLSSPISEANCILMTRRIAALLASAALVGACGDSPLVPDLNNVSAETIKGGLTTASGQLLV